MINIPGVGSGLDLNSLITQLVSAEGNAKTAALAGKRNDVQTEISAFGTLKNALSAFQTAVSKLKDADTFNDNKVSSSAPDVFTVSRNGDIAAAVYDVEVIETAESQKLISPAYESATTDVGTGQLTITAGEDAFTVNIDSDQQSLVGIRDAINNAGDNTGVSATIVNVDDGSGGTVSKLILTADATGTDNLLTVTVADDDLTNTDNTGLSTLYYDTSDATSPEQMTQLNAAVDASIRIDGEQVTSSSNTIVDAIQGITINVLEKDPGNTYTLDISLDTSSLKNAVATFVNSYNKLNTTINSLTVYDQDSGQKGALLGNPTLLSLIGQIRRELNNSVTEISGPVNNLVALGITTDKDGSLTLNNGKLEDVLGSDFNSVVTMFTSSGGIASRFDTLLNDYVKVDGVIDGKTTGLNNTVNRIDQDLSDLDVRLASYQDRLVRQFTALDGLLSQLQQTGDFLNSQLASLPKISSGKSS